MSNLDPVLGPREPAEGPMETEPTAEASVASALETPGLGLRDSPSPEENIVLIFFIGLALKANTVMKLYRGGEITEWIDLTFLEEETIESFDIPHTQKTILRKFVMWKEMREEGLGRALTNEELGQVSGDQLRMLRITKRSNPLLGSAQALSEENRRAR